MLSCMTETTVITVDLAKDLISLSGNKYHRKKNHLNQFIKNFAFEYHPLNADLVKRVLGMQEAWCQIRECVEKPDLLAEDFAVREALTCYEELGYQGGAILINSVVEAFSLGEPLNEDTAVIHIEKANPEIRGSMRLSTSSFVSMPGRTSPTSIANRTWESRV